MIRAVIFDLDNCLAPSDEAGEQILAPTFDAIRKANHGTLDSETLEEAFEESWRSALDKVAEKYGFSKEMLDAGWKENARAEVRTPLHGYGDLDALGRIHARRFLVTSGFRRLQESKIRCLGLHPHFERIEVDAIDEADHQGKAALFEDIIQSAGLKADEVLAVGDNEESEIAAGNELGLRTVQILRPGVEHAGKSTYVVHTLDELTQLIERENGSDG
jgi:putative hydrolase of the HAD superfamily